MLQLTHSANHLLASLAAEKMTALLPHLTVLELPQETVLFETGDTIKIVYFPLSGVVSVVVDLAAGEMIETAMIGRDSLVGGAAAFANQISLNRAVVQVAGAASALNVNRLCEMAQQSEFISGETRPPRAVPFGTSATICGLQRDAHARRKTVALAAQVP